MNSFHILKGLDENRNVVVEFTLSDGELSIQTLHFNLNETRTLDEFLDDYLTAFESGRKMEKKGLGGLVKMNDSELMRDYIQHGNDYRFWVLKAQEILTTATILEEVYGVAREKMQKNVEQGEEPAGMSVFSSMIYLYATALELYLKSALSANDKIIDEKANFLRNTHKLVVLAEALKITLSNEEVDLLNLLTDFIEIWGRYPVPNKYGKWRKPVSVGDMGIKMEGIPPLYVWNDNYLGLLKNFMKNKVISLVPKITW